MEKINTVVIGAGVIGIAIARYFQGRGKDVLLLEKDEHYGAGVSSRNSGVIHAGLYYQDQPSKAHCCVRGKELMYDYVQERGISHKRCGKLIVSFNEQGDQKLKVLKENSQRQGVDDLEFWCRDRIKETEPNLECPNALWSPSSGIIDVHEYMHHLMGDFENAGGTYGDHAAVTQITPDINGFVITVGHENSYSIRCSHVVNAAGLGAQTVARAIQGLDQSYIPKQYLAKGNYFWLEGKAPFNHLIYPLPERGGLGIHSLTDINGRTRFGPDVEWVDAEDYSVNESRKDKFVELIKTYYPSLDGEKLHPDFAGIRPKIVDRNQGVTDFLIQGPKIHGIRGLVNLFGMESPGLTSSLAIPEMVNMALNGER